MKKLLKTMLLACMLCVLTLTMTGCGKENEEQQKQQQDVQNNEETQTAKFTRGEWKDNQYSNDFAKIKFNLPEGWEKASDEEIAKVMNVGVELLNEDQQKLAEQAAGNTVYGMMVNDQSTGANIVLTLEKPAMKVTPEFYLTSLKQQLEALTQMDYEVGEQTTAKIATEEYRALSAKATTSGVTVEQNYYVKAVGDYMVGVIITTTADGQLDTILNSFE